MQKKLDSFTPSHYLTFSVHLDGLRERHDQSVEKEGVFDKAVAAIKEAQDRGFRVTVNCTLFDGEDPEEVADYFDYASNELGIEGITVSPGYNYEFAPKKDVFLGKKKSKDLFRGIFSEGKKRGSKWELNQSSLFLDFLAGNQTY